MWYNAFGEIYERIIYNRSNWQKKFEKEILRVAARAIIFIGDKLLMVKSQKYVDYKFPGGGVKENESLIEALYREVSEETGYEIDLNDISEFGYTIEKYNDLKLNNAVFIQKSVYYLCKLTGEVHKTNLECYEIDFAYKPVIASIEDAIKGNNSSPLAYSIRENRVLMILMESKIWKWFILQ